MIIDCAHYQDGRRRDEGPVPLDEAAARCAQGGFVWLGLFEPGEQELAQVRDTFGLHELAVEDAQNFHMRPKIENYDQDVQLIILRTARYDDAAEEVEFGQISVFLAPSFVITVRQGVASELHGARQRLEQRPELLAAGSASALWAILDEVVDDYAPVVAGLERDIDQIEATVFFGAAAPTERIYSLRREATDFYRTVHPLLAVTGSVERMVDKKLRHYLRDVRDHLLLVDEEVAAQRDLLGTILEANMAVISAEQTTISVQQNSTIEQLTILATVFLPLTFVTGFFGQNFSWLVGHIAGAAAFLVYGIGGLVLPLALLFLWLRLRAPAHKERRRALPQLKARRVPAGRQRREKPRPGPNPRPATRIAADVTGGGVACQTAAMEDAAARTLGRVAANGIELAYETFGDPGTLPVVLVMGLATQMIAWPDEFCENLARRGLFVVRFDNRDVGESTHLRDLPPPRLADIVVRRRPPPYSIGDMAGDVAGLIDGLGLGRVHLVGASMGGFIAQAVALQHAGRVRTVTLIMTSTGSRRVGQPKPRVYARLLRPPVAADRSAAVAAAVETFRLIGSPGFAFDEAYVRDLAGRSWDRGYDPAGRRRQLAASASQPNRTAELRRLAVPALVIHGLDDPLVAPSGGLAVARAIPGSRFAGFSGMGHDLPRALWPEFVREIAALTASGGQRRRQQRPAG